VMEMVATDGQIMEMVATDGQMMGILVTIQAGEMMEMVICQTSHRKTAMAAGTMMAAGTTMTATPKKKKSLMKTRVKKSLMM